MKCSRARFKYELRCLKRHKNQQIGDNLANNLQGGRPDSLQAYVKKAKFWVDSWQPCLKTPKKITD